MDTEIETGPTGARLLPLTVLNRAPVAAASGGAASGGAASGGGAAQESDA